VLEYVLQTELGREVGSIVEEPDTPLHVPVLCDIEVCAGLRGMLNEGDIEDDRAGSALAIYANLPLSRHGHQLLLPRILDLRESFSAQDATYVALCEQLGATLVTADDALTTAVLELLPLNVVGVAGA
jgi:predicted nucleic acid-binding protein